MANFIDNYNFEIQKDELGEKTFFISFVDGSNHPQRLCVTAEVFREMLNLHRRGRNLTRQDERNLEQSELTEQSLHSRAAVCPKSIEEQLCDAELSREIHEAIAELPEKQRRRFVAYYLDKLKLRQIARFEGCSIRAVKDSIDLARNTFEKRIKKF